MSRVTSKKLRTILFAYLFALTVIDNPFTAPFNAWNPLSETLGPWLFASLSAQYRIPLPLSLVEWIPIVLASSSFVICQREGVRRSLPGDALASTLAFFLFLLLSSLTSTFFRGADSSAVYWAVKGPLVIPWLLYATLQLFRTRSHLITCAALVLTGITLKSLQGLYYYFVILGGDKGSNEYITTHTGSYLMSVAILGTAALFAFRPRDFGRRFSLAAAASLIVIVPAFVLNERRIEMVGLVSCLALLIVLVALRTPGKALRISIFLTIAGGIYYGLFRYSKGALGAPISMLESLSDDTNSSNLYRATENFNIIQTILDHNILGQGLGVPFLELLKLPDISALYEWYLINPHNSALWIWMSMGLVGMGLFAWWIATHTFLGFHALFSARDNFTRVCLFVALANVLRYLFFCYGDMMFFNSEGGAVLGVSLGLILISTATPAGQKQDATQPQTR